MKKSLIQILPTAIGLLAGSMCLYFITLFVLLMTYNKRTINVANKDYVQEITRWAGHKHIVNIPVYYPKNI